MNQMQAPETLARNYKLFGRSARWVVPPPDGTCPLLLFAACDARYLDFAVSLARSLDLFSPGFAIAIHVVNASRDDLERLRMLQTLLSATQLAVSMETIDLSHLSELKRRSYYASARFLRLAEIVPSAPWPVLALDADTLVVAPIDLEFTDKPSAEMCLVRRDLHGPVDEHLAVANGSIWMRPTAGTAELLDAVAVELGAAFAEDRADWFIDQVVVGRQVKAFETTVGIFNLKRRYADWQFADGSVIWAGKGERKHTDLRFAVLQRLLLDVPRRQALALRVAAEMLPADPETGDGLDSKIRTARSLVPQRVAIFVPRLDQPWGAAHNPRRRPPALAQDTLDLRLQWKAFAALLANAIERLGLQVELFEWPAREIEPSIVDSVGAQLALIPHRCKLDFAAGATPVVYYMQEYFRWVFVADVDGWSAASSRYPVTADDLASAKPGPFDEYRRRLGKGRLQSKFAQERPAARDALEGTGQIPRAPYVFLPLQIPHDQSIRYFSSVGEREFVDAVVQWCRQRGVALVLKPHPANSKSMAEFEALPRDALLFWSTANIQSLIEHAQAVYTINSGVGFEAMLQLKPVVSFGRAEYDCVSFQATTGTLDAAWDWVRGSDAATLAQRYAPFIDWFLGSYAVDLSRPDASRSRVAELAQGIVDRVQGQAATAVAK